MSKYYKDMSTLELVQEADRVLNDREYIPHALLRLLLDKVCMPWLVAQLQAQPKKEKTH